MRPQTSAPLATLLLVFALVPLSVVTSALNNDPEETGAFGAAGTLIAAVTGRIQLIVAPTSGAPAFVLAGEGLRVELSDPPSPAPASVTLRPSFGGGADVVVPVALGASEGSQLWQGPYARVVHPLTGTVPSTTPAALYDIVIPGLDDERRALRVYAAWPETVRLVLVADTQTGDPRALTDGFADSTGIDPQAPHQTDPGELQVPPDPEPFNQALDETLGIDVLNVDLQPGDRWAAYREAIRQINLLAPDLVLFSGDLTFGQLVPASYHVEYEEAWTLINGGTTPDGAVFEGFHAPTLLSPGNHDGYVADGEDGFAFWKAYFGPPAFKTSFGDILFVSINTYDWSELDRMGVSLGVSAWGGQVREHQLEWLRKQLCVYQGGTIVPDPEAIAGISCAGAANGRVVTFAHHSPSWEQDIFNDEFGGFYGQCPCEGTPGLEQVARGAITFTTTGQGWTGEGRLELRDTLREFQVDIHAAGHTHRDRVARDIGTGDIVEVPQRARPGLDITQLQLVTTANVAMAIDQALARSLLANPALGPLYVETTTAASDTSEYFGYRPVTWHPSLAAFPIGARGIPPFEMGYPMTRALLDDIARDPERWNETHADLGLFSTPTFVPT